MLFNALLENSPKFGHQMSMSEICDKLYARLRAAHQIDSAAIAKYKLAQMNDSDNLSRRI